MDEGLDEWLRMDRWVSGWMDGCWVNEDSDEWLDELINGLMGG